MESSGCEKLYLAEIPMQVVLIMVANSYEKNSAANAFPFWHLYQLDTGIILMLL
jgi:hypothetical protein